MWNKVKQHHDVIIVGGGINGVGIARDLALRGVDVLLVEKGDFSSGTSWASSGMIHGGPRYMLSDVGITKLSCLDSGYIQKIAPHLLFRVPFLYTVYKQAGKSSLASRILLETVETFFKAYDKFVPLKNGKKHTRLSAKEVVELEPNIPKENLLGGVTFDEWGIDVPRLCIANVIDACEHGAVALNHTLVSRVISENGVVKGVDLKNEITGEKKSVTCKILVNATGPWSPEFAKLMGVEIKLRGGKGVHLVFDRRLFNMAIVSQCIDGREIFIMPYENTSILGTTDDDFFGDLDNQKVTQDEVNYLLDGICRVFPAIKDARLTYSFSGVRPTLYERGVYEDDLSREHEILDHETRDKLKGAVSIIGGKLASYRIMSQEVADVVAKKLGVVAASTTHEKPLPGGDSLPDVMGLAEKYHVDAFAVSRLVYRHGSRAVQILERCLTDESSRALVCTCEPVLKAEIDHVIENEMAQTLSDVRRRTRFSLGPCQATNCLIGTSALLAESKDLSGDQWQENVTNFSREWWPNRAAVLTGEQLKQEELNQAIHNCNNSFMV